MFNKYLLLENLQNNFYNENLKISFINGLRYYKSYFISNFEEEQYLEVLFNEIVKRIESKINKEIMSSDLSDCKHDTLISTIGLSANSKELINVQSNVALFLDGFICGNSILNRYITYISNDNNNYIDSLSSKIQNLKEDQSNIKNCVSEIIDNIAKETESTIKITEILTHNIKIPFFSKEDALDLVKYQYEKEKIILDSSNHTDTNFEVFSKEILDKNKLNSAVVDLVDMGFYDREEIQNYFGFSNLEMDYIMHELNNK